MKFENLPVIIFVFVFFLSIAGAMISYIAPHKFERKYTSLKEIVKTFWSETLLIIGIIVGAYFIIKGLNV
jgi:hypothetical protein